VQLAEEKAGAVEITYGVPMKYDICNLPKGIKVNGKFGKGCYIELSERSLQSIINGKLQVSVTAKRDQAINNVLINIGSKSGKQHFYLSKHNVNIKLGAGTRGAYTFKAGNCSINIGEKTSSNGCEVFCHNGDLIIGKDCMFSSGICLQASDQHGLVDLKTGEIYNSNRTKTVIGDHVWLGRGSTVLHSLEIGNGAVLGVGAVAFSDIPAFSVAIGNPARVIKKDVTWTRNTHQLDKSSVEYCKEYSIDQNKTDVVQD